MIGHAADLILSDKLQEAKQVLKEVPQGGELLAELLTELADRPVPLQDLRAKTPPYVAVHASYTCDVRCRMCNSGFQNRSSLYEDYKYFLPEQFDRVSEWFELGTHAFFVGTGETLDSPYIIEFLEKVSHKISVVTTSGVPLDEEKIRNLISAGLKILNISFDGKTSIGHGAGSAAYIKNIWEKIHLLQRIKKEMRSETPELGLHVTVNKENLDNLEEIFSMARENGIKDILLLPMTVTNDTGRVNEMLYEKSFASDFEKCKNKLNAILADWEKSGVRIRIHEETRMYDSMETCSYVDNAMQFHGKKDRPSICCGPLTLPLGMNGMPAETYWNTFPLRYFRHLHFCSGPDELPAACKTCWVMYPKKYSEECQRVLSGKGKDGLNVFEVYQKASALKKDNDLDLSKEMFEQILDLAADNEMKGKIYFHLGEIQLLQKNYWEALPLMEIAVQHCYSHKVAFAYLYLLMQMLEGTGAVERKEKYPMSYRP